MGELPPSRSTPQGPGVPRASRPGFPRVDSSGTSSAPSSRSTITRFAHLLSPGAFPPPSRSPFPSPSFRPVFSTVRYSFLHGSLRPCPLVFPSVSFPYSPFLRPVIFSSLHFVPHTASRFVLLSLPRVSPWDSTLPRLCFPRCRFGYVFLSFLLCFLQLPSLSFPFLSSSSLQFSPLSSSSVLPSSSRPHGVPTFPRSPSESRVLPPLSRGSVSVARGSRRSAPTPLQRSGKVNRNGSGN